MACFCSGVIPDVLAIICDFVMYIFVFMFTPTTGSLAAQCGMLPIEDDMEEDMELWASVGRLLPRSTAVPSTVAAARLFIFIGSPFEAITLQARFWMSFGAASYQTAPSAASFSIAVPRASISLLLE